MISREHGNDRKYYQLFAQLDCLTEENFEAVIGDIGQDYPEMKAYFMSIRKKKLGMRISLGSWSCRNYSK